MQACVKDRALSLSVHALSSNAIFLVLLKEMKTAQFEIDCITLFITVKEAFGIKFILYD
jgi:hypothetical protein